MAKRHKGGSKRKKGCLLCSDPPARVSYQLVASSSSVTNHFLSSFYPIITFGEYHKVPQNVPRDHDIASRRDTHLQHLITGVAVSIWSVIAKSATWVPPHCYQVPKASIFSIQYNSKEPGALSSIIILPSFPIRWVRMPFSGSQNSTRNGCYWRILFALFREKVDSLPGYDKRLEGTGRLLPCSGPQDTGR